MARLEVARGRVEVVLGPWERVGAWRGDVSVAVGEVARVRTSVRPFSELHGLLAPGTGMPQFVALGTWRYRGGKDFFAIYRGRRAVVVDVSPGGEFGRLIVGVDDPEATETSLRDAVRCAVR